MYDLVYMAVGIVGFLWILLRVAEKQERDRKEKH